MKKRVIIVIIILLVSVVVAIRSRKESSPEDRDITPTKTIMLLTSPSFNHNEKIPPKFTCDGGNINPELHIQNVPPEAKSLALIVDDPDAVGDRTFTHWLIWNIDPKTEVIKQESVPPGSSEGQNGAGKVGYIGPCPPDGKPHRYFFKLYALDIVALMIEETPNNEMLEKMIGSHVIEKTEFIGIYER